MIILYILSPFISTIIYALILLNNKTVTKKQLWHLAFMLSIYLGLLNSTKELLGDFAAYHYDYINIPNYTFFKYLLEFGKEPVYTSYAYISYYLFNGSWKLYVIGLTSINYLLISYCIIKLSVYLKSNYRNTIVALFIMAFFFQEFAAVGNIMRQAPAQALAMAFLTKIYLEKKYNWWLALCAIFTHSAALPIIGIGILPIFHTKLNIKKFIKTIVILAIFVFVFFKMESVLSGIPFVGYIYQKTNNTDALFGTDSWQVQLGFNFFTLSLVTILIIISVYIYYKNWKQKEIPTIGVVNINIVLLFMLIICDTIGAYYLFLRYFFFIYTFQNLLILYFMHQIKLNNNFLRLFCIAVITTYFFYCYSHNIFKYTSVIEAVFTPLPLYL